MSRSIDVEGLPLRSAPRVVTIVSSIQQRLYVHRVDDKYFVSYNAGREWEEMNKDGLYAYFEADNVLGPWEFARYSKMLDCTFFKATCKDYRHWDDLLRIFCMAGDDVDPASDLPPLVFHSGQRLEASYWAQLDAVCDVDR